MARLLVKYPLNAASTSQPVDMPRRAKILHVSVGDGGPMLYAEVLEDADTKAFDVKHLRHFVVVMAGGTIPEGAGYVGSCALRVGKASIDYHVFETQSPRPARVTQRA